MATDVETRPVSKPDAYLRRQFAELCGRIKRADLTAHGLVLALSVLVYALLAGIFDWFAGASTSDLVTATRWIGFALFVGVFAYRGGRTLRCLFRRVNPYFVAQQIEQASDGAKNTLINWLDMQDEELPAAFQRNLSARAAEALNDGNVEQVIPRRRNGLLLLTLAAPAAGLALLLLLGPLAFSHAMQRAFVPFVAPPPTARTHIELVQPTGDVEVSPGRALTFQARIDGHVPVGNRPDAPRLAYRYHAGEDFLTQPLQQDSSGLWKTLLHPGQIRTGLYYKITAGDNETSVHQVRLRGRAHVKLFTVAYRHRPYRGLPEATPTVFPNEVSSTPIIHGPPGSDVELIVQTSRPIKRLSIETVFGTDKPREMETRRLADDSFACQWTLERSGHFRVLFTASDGEENADREFHPIDVLADDAPVVVLTEPGKDVSLPANATLVLDGRASSHIGLTRLTLHLHVIEGPDRSRPPTRRDYRPGASLQFDDGTFPRELEYAEVVPLNRFLDDGPIHHFSPGTVIEYWLEAIDAADFPVKSGNVGASPKFRVTLTSPAPAGVEEKKRQQAHDRQRDKQKQQDDKHASDNKDRKDKKDNKDNQGKSDPSKKSAGGGQTDQKKQQLDAAGKVKKETGDKIKQAMQNQQDNKDRGNSKQAGPPDAGAKGAPPDSPDAPQPLHKDQSAPPQNAGADKNQGEGKEQASEAKSDGKKAGDKGEPHAGAKGAEQDGPPASNKSAAEPPPGASAKAGKSTDDANVKPAPKQEPSEPAPGNARGDHRKDAGPKSELDQIADRLDQLAGKDGPEKESAAAVLAKLAQGAADPALRALAKDILDRNGRDAKTGEKMKMKGISRGKSPGLSDDLKAAAANRAFAARIGQLQLDDWKKRVTPDLLKRAGISEADWRRYVQSVEDYGKLVRALNAQIARESLQELRGSGAPGVQSGPITGKGNTPLDAVAPTPPELLDVQRRFTTPRQADKETGR